jgi:hypothetical protein
VQAEVNTFVCKSNDALWDYVRDPQFTYDTDKKTMTASYEDLDNPGKFRQAQGVIDNSYKPKTAGKVRFVQTDGRNFSDFLTDDSYACDFMATADLLKVGSVGGKLNFTCRGESFQNAWYDCKKKN